AIPHFVRMLNSVTSDQHLFVSALVSKALGEMGEPAIEYLANMLQDVNTFLALFAVDALKEIGKPAVPTVIRTLKNVNFLAVERLGLWLAEIQAIEAIEPLLALTKSNPLLMQFIRKALVKFGDAAVEPLIRLTGNAEVFTQPIAMETLAELGGERA